ncbi:unnamed protein product [Larinioides sclopetarius]|uniref:Uncharacterized protein n=1 Tax=Larinioides sclopetarius TaxID=280406 RepID=A0AAV2B8T0_9ARAC
MRSKASNKISEELLKSLFLQRLPAQVQQILAIANDKLDRLAEVADGIMTAASDTGTIRECVVQHGEMNVVVCEERSWAMSVIVCNEQYKLSLQFNLCLDGGASVIYVPEEFALIRLILPGIQSITSVLQNTYWCILIYAEAEVDFSNKVRILS